MRNKIRPQPKVTRGEDREDAVLPDPYRDVWTSLSPAKRLRRSWNLRTRLVNLHAAHDAKTFPEL